MYYRVKRYSGSYNSMFVLDQDNNLSSLRSRTTINCVGIGPKVFQNAQFVQSQKIQCINLGLQRDSDIIKE